MGAQSLKSPLDRRSFMVSSGKLSGASSMPWEVARVEGGHKPFDGDMR